MGKIIVFGVNPFNAFLTKGINKKIFYSKFGGNTGNLLFGRAIGQYLKKPGNVLEYGLYNFFEKDFIKKISDECDLLVLPLANHIGPHLKDELVQLTKLVEARRGAVVLIGIGAQSSIDFSFDFLRGIESEVKKFLSAVVDRSCSFAVRGDFTADVVKRLGFGKYVRVTGCPSFYMNARKFHVNPVDCNKPVQVAFNISPQTEDYFCQLSNENSDGSSFVTQYFLDSENITSTLYSLAKANKLHLFGNFETWSKYQANHDFTISTRIHGSIISLLSGTPAYLIATDSRTKEMAEFFSIPHCGLNEIGSKKSTKDYYYNYETAALIKNYQAKLDYFINFLNENQLRHNLNEPDGGKGYLPKVEEDIYQTLATIEDSEIIDYLMKQGAEMKNSITELGNRLKSNASAYYNVKHALGSLLGASRVRKLKYWLGMENNRK